MASIIKNQIIKHLSAFARNLKPEQITVEVLRGKGQLRNLELNEEVLAERLELPPWLIIVSAHCSSVSVKIPWTKLKSAPIQLFVEEIQVTIRLVASAIPNKSRAELANGKTYDLAERVIEGISLHVQSIEVYFESDSQSQINFGGSLMLSQFVLESRTPNWQEERNINMTRIHDKTNRQVLFFKHIHWRVLKIEASANLKSDTDYGLRQPQRSSLNSPLRFLTENGRMRIAIKKSTLDCSLIAGRMELILDEIHWLAYMAHLRSAIDFYKHVLDLANSVGKKPPLPVAKQQLPFATSGPVFTPKLTSPAPSSSPLTAFRQFDIAQSSHHLIISRIDLHLCDDSALDDLPPDWNIESGAMQAIIQKLRVDFYPQHRVFEHTGQFSERHSWLRYSSPNPFTELAKMQLDQHFRLLNNAMEPNLRDRFVRVWPQLTSQNVVIRIENLVIQSVSERTTKKEALKCILSVNRRLKDKLPQLLSFFHLELSSYSFPATDECPVPPDSVHLILAPVELAPDPKSVRWLVYAFENILNSFETPQISSIPSSASSSPVPELRLELIMPTLVLLLPSELPPSPPLPDDSSTRPGQLAVDPRLPKRFLFQASTAILTNFTLLNDPSVPSPVLLKTRLQESHLEFIKWAEGSGNNAGFMAELERRCGAKSTAADADNNESFLLKSGPDYPATHWSISVPALWATCDFGPDTWELPFLSDFNIFGSLLAGDGGSGKILLLEPRTDIGLVLNHFQFVQLVALLDRIGLVMDQISSDRQFFRKHLAHLPDDLPISVFCQCEQVHLRLVLPAGPTPSPYDQKWLGRDEAAISPSNTSITCSDFPTDEPVIAAFPANSSAMRKNSTFSADERIFAVLTPTADATGALASLQDCGVKAVDPLARGAKLAEELGRRKQLTGTPPFSPPNYPMAAATPSDLESNLDETLSITTSASIEQFDGTIAVAEDIFGEADEVVEAEEATESSEQDIRALGRKEKFMGREVNVFDLLLTDFNIHAKAEGGRTRALGFAGSVECGERIRLKCGDVYAEKGSTFDVPHKRNMLGEKQQMDGSRSSKRGNPMEGAKLSLQFHSAPHQQSEMKLNLNGLHICLSDEVVSQLAPFIQNSSVEDENAAKLEISLQKCNIQIKDPKKRFPLRITLGELTIQDGSAHEEPNE